MRGRESESTILQLRNLKKKFNYIRQFSINIRIFVFFSTSKIYNNNSLEVKLQFGKILRELRRVDISSLSFSDVDVSKS